MGDNLITEASAFQSCYHPFRSQYRRELVTETLEVMRWLHRKALQDAAAKASSDLADSCRPQGRFSSSGASFQTNKTHVHRAVAILGPRGSGKTSFLHTLIGIIQGKVSAEEYSPYRQQDGRAAHDSGTGGPRRFAEGAGTYDFLSRIRVAGVVESSRLSPTAMIVSEVVGSLYADGTICGLANMGRTQPAFQAFLEASGTVMERLKRLVSLGQGLGALQKEQGEEALFHEFSQPSLVSDVERAVASFIDAYLALTGSQAVVIGFDDADWAFGRQQDVLEALRLYLTHPALILLVTGDQKLFEHGLRVRFERLIYGNNNKDQGHEAKVLLDQMVEQYLQKVLPPVLRVHLSPLDANSVSVGSENGVQEGEVSLRTHFEEFVNTVLSLPPGKEMSLVRFYNRMAVLMPKDARRLSMLSTLLYFKTRPPAEGSKAGLEKHRPLSLGGEVAAGKGLGLLAELWREELLRWGLEPEWIEQLSDAKNPGRWLFEKYVGNDRMLALGPGLVSQALDPEACAIRALVQLCLERNMRKKGGWGSRIAQTVEVLLDYYVPAWYRARGILQKTDLGLGLDENPRRALHRLLPLVCTQHPVVVGVARVCVKPGAFEKRLDIARPDLGSHWRSARSARASGVVWERDLYTRWEQTLQLLELNKSQSSISSSQWSAPSRTSADSFEDDTTQAGARTQREERRYLLRKARPGVVWARYLLPRSLFPGSAWRERDNFNADWLLAQRVTSPDIFLSLAGAWPATVLRMWTVSESGNYYVSIWKALSIIRTSLNAMSGVDQPSFEHARTADQRQPGKAIETPETPPHTSPDPVAAYFNDLVKVLCTALVAETWAETSGLPLHSAPDRWKEDTRNSTTSEWERLYIDTVASRVNAFSDPRIIYEHNTGPLGNTKHIPAWTPLQQSDADAQTGQHANGPKGHDGVQPEGTNTDGGSSWNSFQSKRTLAFDVVLENRFAKPLAEWYCHWAKAYSEEEGNNINSATDSIVYMMEKAFDVLTEDLADQADSVDSWNGVGDIIQNWVHTFLNSLLIACDRLMPDQARTSGGRRPLVRSGNSRTPVRLGSSMDEEGTHPLYQNLRVIGSDISHSRFNTFRLLASCPIFSMFTCTIRCGNECAKNTPFSDDVYPSYDQTRKWVMGGGCPACGEQSSTGGSGGATLPVGVGVPSFGCLSLSPFPVGGRHSKTTGVEQADLCGLSWSGVAIALGSARATAADDGAEGQKKEELRLPIIHYADRRRVLVEMLNSMVADVQPCPECEPSLPEIALSVEGALAELIPEHFESLGLTSERDLPSAPKSGGKTSARPSRDRGRP